MRAILFLNKKYIKGHVRQSVGVVLCVSLFLTAFLTTLLYRDSARATTEAQGRDEYGSYTGIVYHADAAKVAAQMEAIEESGSGVVRVTHKVKVSDTEKPLYLGSMDPNSLSLKSIHIQEGRLPERAGEVAMEETAYAALGLQSQLGEPVTLTLSEEDALETREYTLVGILEPYIAKWQSLDSSKNSVSKPPPTILTIPNDEPAEYMHVLCGEADAVGDLGGEYSENSFYMGGMMTENRNLVTDIMLLPLLLFFVVVTAFGVYSIVKFTLQERQRYMGFLRCVGLSKRRGVGLFFLQGCELFFISSFLSTGLSILLLFGIVEFSRLLGNSLQVYLSLQSFCYTYLIALLVILGISLFPVLSFFQRSPLETGTRQRISKRRRKQNRDQLAGLWAHATRSAYRSTNLISIMLAAFCMLLTVFGSFISIFEPRVRYSSIAVGERLRQVDYMLYVPGGTSNGENFYLTFPRSMGISPEDLDLLYHTEGLQVNSAEINNMTFHFLLAEQGTQDPYLLTLMDRGALENSRVEEAVELAGGKPGDQLVELQAKSMDYPSVEKMLPDLVEGHIDKQRFLAGEEIIAPDSSGQKVGDVYTMITPYSTGDSENESSAQVELHVSQVRVAALYSANPDSSNPNILSSEFSISLEPGLHYDSIFLKNLQKENETVTQNIEKTLSYITAKSERVSMDNIIQKRKQFVQDVQSQQIQTTVSVCIFMITVILALALSTNVKVRTNMRSYLLMRALGAGQKTIRKLLIFENLRLILYGSLIGGGCALAILFFMTRDFGFIPSADIYFGVVLPSALGVFLILCALTILAIRKPVKKLLEKSISEELNAIEY